MSGSAQDARLALLPPPIDPPEEVKQVDLSSRRWSSRSRRSLTPSVRVRSNGPGGAATFAAVAAIGIALTGVAGAIRTPVAWVAAASSAAGARVPVRSFAPIVAPAAALPDVPWLAERGDGRWVFGRGERGPVRRLPAGETGLAIGAGFVASVVPDAGGHSIVRMRDGDSGRLRTEVSAPIWVSAAAWTRAGLVVTGYGDSSATSDGGLLLIAAESGGVTTLVPAAPFSRRLGEPVARGEVLVSPSGETVASNACGPERCDLQMVELATGAVTRPIHDAPGFLRAVTDDLVVTTDDSGAWISARAITDGAERWRLRNRSLIDPVALADGSIVGLTGSRRGGWAIATIDDAGRSRDLTPRGRGNGGLPQVWRPFSLGETVVVASSTFAEALERGRPLSVSLLGARDGHAVKVAVHLPATSEAVP